MKIRDIQIFPISQRQEDPGWSFALASYAAIDGFIVCIHAEDQVGYGYASILPHIGSSREGILSALKAFKPRLIGRSPFEIEPILHDLDIVIAGNLQAKAGVDCALYDLSAKLLKQPLCNVLGGAFRTEVNQIRIVPIKAPSLMAAESRKLVDAGYRSLKIKLKGVVKDDVDRVKAIREEVGSDILLTLDPNQSYVAKDAISALHRMEAYDVYLVEQPVAASDWKGLEQVTKAVSQVVEADESAASVDDVFALASGRIVDAVSLKIPKLGGLRNTLLAAKICHTAGVKYRMGAAFGPRLLAAQGLHLAAALPKLDLPCELAEFDHLFDDPFSGLEVEGGKLNLPMAIGSGVSIDPQWLRGFETGNQMV